MSGKTPLKRICVVPQLSGVGGMVSFQHKFVGQVRARGFQVTFDLTDFPYDGVLVIGGTRNLGKLRAARRHGIPIVQRLNGMNWIHRKRWTGLGHFLRAERGNWLLSIIRRRFVDSIVYQSHFVHDWWDRVYGTTRTPSSVVYNGVNLGVFSPVGPGSLPGDRWRLLVVEGRLGGGYEIGIDHAVQLAENLSARLEKEIGLAVVGVAGQRLREYYERKSKVDILWFDAVPGEDIPEINRSAHLLFSADLNAACPNSVIEAMACGCPVIGFATGGLPELVKGDAGCITPYGGNVWKLEEPDFETLAVAGVRILHEQERFRQGARARALEMFDLDTMVDGYLKAFGWV